ncbi:MAG: type III pantothenate kinase [Cyclobacteriaceae bacterium]|nr:type III pantothenate kinase [Cyclobacteriaceae bacterium]
MEIAVDFGTSSAKIGFFKGNELVEVKSRVTIGAFRDYIESNEVVRAIVSTVSYSKEEILQQVKNSEKIVFLSNTTPVPITLDYKTPETLGMDRLAAAVGAFYMFPNKNCLIIDAGSCITIDLIDEHGVYHGGSISPGIDLKFKALHNYTANLPLVMREEQVTLMGKSTRESILSGVINGTRAEIREIIRMYQNKFPILHLVICGGDAHWVSEGPKTGAFMAPDLVLRGLKNILDYNVK